VLLDDATEEGAARGRFLRSFSSLERKEPESMLDTTRQFMESLRLYLQAKRGADMCHVLSPSAAWATAVLKGSAGGVCAGPLTAELLGASLANLSDVFICVLL